MEETSSQSELSYRFDCRPDFSFLTVNVPANKTIRVEASAMATMDTNMEMRTKAKGGLSRLVTGESIFINEFKAAGGPGEITIAPGAPGDMEHVYLDGEAIYLQNSAFVGSSMSMWPTVATATESGSVGAGAA